MTIPAGFELVALPDGFEEVDDGDTHIEMVNGVPTSVKGGYKAPVQPTRSAMDYVKGVGEVGLNALTSIPAMIPGAVMEAMGKNDQAKKFMEEYTYAPRTELGQEGAANLGELVNSVGIPMLGVHLPAPKGIRKYNRKLQELTKVPEGFEEVHLPPDPIVKPPPADMAAQAEMFKPDEQGWQPNKYEANKGDWRVDENGIPVRADKSLDALNVEEPLQRNLFGDELPQAKGEDIPLTEAIDSMDWAHRRGAIKNELTGAVEASGALEGAMLEATPARVIPKSQRGAIDLGAPKPKVEYVERADGIDAFVDGVKVGYLNDNLPRGLAEKIGENANVDIVKVVPEFVGQGIGKGLYDRFSERHGGNIAPSGKTSPSAWRLWERNFPAKVTEFVSQESKRLESGAPLEQVLGNITDPAIRSRVAQGANQLRVLDETLRVPQGQRGGVDFNAVSDAVKKMVNAISPPPMKLPNTPPIVKNNVEAMHRVPGLREATKNWIPDDAPVNDVKAAILKEGAENGKLTMMNLRSGIQATAAQRQSPMLTEGGRWILNANKRAEKNIDTFVVPVEKSMRRLESKDVLAFADTIKAEDAANTRYTPEQLTKLGLDDKKRAVYDSYRQMQDQAFEKQNAARIKQGMEPLTRRDAYLASVWGGRFTIPIYNKAGKLVWMIGEKTQREAMRAKEWLKKSGVEFDEGKAQLGIRGKVEGPRGLFEDDFANMKQMIDNTDPESIKAEAAYGQSKHFEDKSGARGFKGDRPWNDPVSEAYELVKGQMNYAKNAFKWAEMQEATAKVKEVLADKDIQSLQPSNAEYLRQYTKKELGYGQWAAVRALEDAVTEQFGKLGIAPGQGGQAVSMAKTVFILKNLAANVGFFGGQLLQTLYVIPEHSWLTDRGYKHNVVKTTAAAAMDWSRGLGAAKMDFVTGGRVKSIGPMTSLGKDAWAYMKDNGITNRTVVDEAAGMGQNPGFEMFAHAIGTGIRGTENFIRGNAFLSFAHHLEQSGKFANDAAGRKKLFQMAEEATERSMVSWRTSERAMAFEKMGTIGSGASTLKSYLVSFWNQMGRHGEEALKGNVKPLLGMVALQQLLFGTTNIPGMQDADALWEKFKGMVPDSAYQHIKDFSIKKTLISKMPDWLAYGGVSKLTGVNFASRGQVGLADSASLDGMFPFFSAHADLVKNVVGAATNPNETTMNQLAYSAMPAGPATGMYGQSEAFKAEPESRADGTQAFQKPKSLAKHDFDYARTQKQMDKKNWGFTELEESRDKDLKFMQGGDERQLKERRDDNITKAWDAIVRGDKDNLNKAIDYFIKFDGDPKQLENMLIREATKMHASPEQILAMKSSPSITDMQRLKRIKDLVGRIN